MRKNLYRAYWDILLVHNIYYGVLQIFLLSPTLLFTSTHVDSPTISPIQILLPIPFHIYPIICFIFFKPFPTLLHVFLTNLFLWNLLQILFSVYCALRFLTIYDNFVHMHYALGVRITEYIFVINCLHLSYQRSLILIFVIMCYWKNYVGFIKTVHTDLLPLQD